MTWDAVIWIGALLALSSALGLLWKSRTGRARPTPATRVDLAEVPAHARATLLQFSTAICSACPPTRRLLGSIAAETPGVHHVDINLSERPELATQFGILQTPTTFVLDAAGVVRARIGGAPRPQVVRDALRPLLGAPAPAPLAPES
jgi:thioredoxin-like negative regulator of GroEL